MASEQSSYSNPRQTVFYDIGEEANQYVKWAFSRLRYISSTIQEMIKKDGSWMDLVQELHAVGYDSWQQNLTVQQTRNYAGRRIRLFFKHYGYRYHRFTYFRQEIPLSMLPQHCPEDRFADYELDKPEQDFQEDAVTLRHMEKRVLSTLRRNPNGVNRYIMSKRLGVGLKEAQRYLDKLVKDNEIVRVERECWHGGRTSALYFIAGEAVPQRLIRTEYYKSIWEAYFVEHKSRSQIQRETHHHYYTILKAIEAAPPELAASNRE
jgi:hypothetical protein